MSVDYAAELAGLSDDAIPAYLSAHSNLPGPRSNLELAYAFAATASEPLVTRLAADDDEYLRVCGVMGLGPLIARGDLGRIAVLRENASSPLWRVREGVAMALQLLGDEDPARLREIVTEWSADADPLVQRAGIAAICEPRLLKDERTALLAVDACARTTRSLLARTDRRDPPVRVLRQALGYCWSVAIAAVPGQGLAAFAELQRGADPDAAWIVRENLTKARLKRLLPA